jgi:hypothetical protein
VDCISVRRGNEDRFYEDQRTLDAWFSKGLQRSPKVSKGLQRSPKVSKGTPSMRMRTCSGNDDEMGSAVTLIGRGCFVQSSCYLGWIAGPQIEEEHGPHPGLQPEPQGAAACRQSGCVQIDWSGKESSIDIHAADATQGDPSYPS